MIKYKTIFYIPSGNIIASSLLIRSVLCLKQSIGYRKKCERFGTSFIYIVKIKGPSTDPWWTPEIPGKKFEVTPLNIGRLRATTS